MTPRELAERIVDLFSDEAEVSDYIVPKIEALLTEFRDSQKFMFYEKHNSDGTITRWSEHFENAIKESAAQEREACAKVAEECSDPWAEPSTYPNLIAEKIRARGK